MFAVRASSPVESELAGLAEGLEGLDMRGAALLAPELLDHRDRVVRGVRRYLVPRLTDPARPMTVVIAGPTGSGKSTILNSLTGLDLAETGALRPTTKTPLVVTTAEQAGRFQELGGVRCHVAAARIPILTRMALVDTPDIDSTSVDHRRMAEALIDSADAVVFVTSPSRYADLVPWEVLRRAVERGAPLIAVINRVTPSAAAAVADYRSRLARAGIDADVIRVPEHRGGPGLGRVPDPAVKELTRRLGTVSEQLEGGRLAGVVVAENLLAEATRLVEALEGVHRLVERTAGEVEDLVDRGRSRLSLEPVLNGITLPIGPGGRVRRLLRLPPSRVSGGELAEWLGTVTARLSSAVESELRATAADLEALLPWVPGHVVIEPALVTLATAIHGWLAHVRGVTGAMGRRRHLATAVLVLRCLRPSDHETGGQVLGPSARALVADARADLETRLAVAFSQLAMVVSARIDAVAGAGPSPEVSELITRARARLTFADA